MTTAIQFYNNQRATSSNISLSSNNTSAYQTSIASNDRSDYWEVDGTNTEEWILIDLETTAQPVTFLGLVSEFGEPFELQRNATVKIQANNVDLWTAPPLDETATVTDLGIFHQVTATDNTYRYWRVKITDAMTNFDYPSASRHVRFSNVWLSDHIVINTTNVALGFEKGISNPTSVSVSDTGKLFSNTRKGFAEFGGMNLNLIPAADRRLLEQFSFDRGIHLPFYCSIDPSVALSDGIEELTRFVYFSAQPVFSHDIRDYFSMSFSLREVV